MHRIQAFTSKGHCIVRWANTMEERNQIIKELIESGCHPASISEEWLARKGY